MIRNRLTASARTTLDEQLTRDAKANAYQLWRPRRFVRTLRGQDAVNRLFRDVVLGCIDRKAKLKIDPHYFEALVISSVTPRKSPMRGCCHRQLRRSGRSLWSAAPVRR